VTEELPEPSFRLLVTQFAAQALMQLGVVPNPLTGQAEISLPRARFTMGLLELLENRTQGNLEEEEELFLQETLSQLRTRFPSTT